MKTLTVKDELFALEYLANGRNATEAYAKLHPKARRTTCSVEGFKVLRKPTVAKFIEKHDLERKASLIMDADEALQGLTRHARQSSSDVRRLFKNGRLLPIEEWPDDVADCVKSLKPGPFGTTITFYDKQKARITMAINGGKLRGESASDKHFPHLELLGDEPPDDED